MKDISKYYNGVPVFKHLNLAFEKGRIHVLMGESGSGKTTLIRILMGLENIDGGEIIGMEGMKQAAVFQEDRLCENLSVSLNIRLPYGKLSYTEEKEIKEKIRSNLECVGLAGIAGKPVRELSGGMKRRVAILRAVMAKSEILFFDEPLKGLDIENKKRIMDFLQTYLLDKTVFWVTHDRKDLEYLKNPKCWEFEKLS